LDEEEEAQQVDRGYDDEDLSDVDDEEDELNDFIVEGDDDGEQQPGMRRRRKKKKHIGGVSDEAMRVRRYYAFSVKDIRFPVARLFSSHVILVR
jgi:hypothetical protein